MNTAIETPTSEQLERYEALKCLLASYGSAALAFSGGVDSALLLHAAHEALGERALAITARSALFPQRELDEAQAFCRSLGARHVVVDFDELQVEGFAGNPVNRCYLCKTHLFGKIKALAAAEGLSVVAEGSNLDDLGDYRPGLQAVEELGIESPLRTCGFTKADIRALSRHLGLPTWNKQSFACLASRVPYGETISREKLEMVAKAEQLLLDLGFHQLRVRVHGTMARIEVVPDEFEKLVSEDARTQVTAALRSYGFSYVAMDLAGYRSGSMNETLG
ncbi:MAG: ATP-dependent sacrificial sulfur transferase LarE [Coriobacteriales bacterium]